MSLLSLFGVSNAHAASAGASAGSHGGLMSMLPMLIILVLFMYFLIIRPQSKKAKEHRELMASLKKGDEVMTSGGLLGTITKLSDNFIALEISNGVEIRLQRGAISASLPKGTIKAV
ncbi:MAG: preprotein translocase subunit YajC [Gammaproteobacteria bacterium]|nr:preprotein translocase subunit YajC [Gammaproteobacteria bacterium]